MLSTTELQKQFSTEQVFIILLIRLYFGKSTKEELENLCKDQTLNYDEVWKTSAIHGIRPFLYHIIQHAGLQLDEGFVSRFKTFYIENQLRSLEQLSICHNVISDLKAEGVTAIPFKGATFSEIYYQNIGLRESTDIDLFVDEKNVEVAEKLLQAKNFEPKLTVPEFYIKYYKRNFKEIVYTAPAKTRSGYSIEIHWKLLNYYFGKYPDFSFFLKRTYDARIKQLNFQLFDPTADFLVLVSNHFIKDLGVKFKYVIDLAVLLEKHQDQLDYNLISDIGDRYKCRKKIDLAFYTIEQLTGVKTPFKNKYKFNTWDLASSLSAPISISNFQVSSPSFLKRSLELQDDNLSKLKFLCRCAYYFFLPTDNDLRPHTKIRTSVFLLAIVRPFRLAYKALAQQKH